MSDATHVYLMAFACEPDRGSEPGVGFAFARAGARLAREGGHRVTLVTRPHRVDRIRAALGEDEPYLRVLAVPIPRLVVRLTGRRHVRAAAVLWQLLASLRVRAELRAAPQGAAVVHHVSFASEAVPTFEGLLRPQAGLVFGPAGSATIVGGGLRTRARRLLRSVVARHNLAAADVLVAQNPDVAASWSAFGDPAVVEANVVIEPLAGARPPVRWSAATAGLLIERKRFDLAIDAFARSGDGGRMVVIGDGPERARLEALAARRGVAEQVDFVGFLPREAVVEHLAQSRVLLHPSRQEGAGWVVGEAQSVGATPIVFEGSGADGPVLAAGIGAVVDPVRPEAMTDSLRDVLLSERAEPSGRWSADRLPGLMDEWYRLALLRSAARRNG